MSTLQTINVKHPSSASNNLVLDSSGNATIANNTTIGGNATIAGSMVAASSYAWRNRIINGDMRVAQRGVASVNTNESFPVDRFVIGATQSAKFSAVSASATPPTGFTNYIRCTSSSAYTPLSTDEFEIIQKIEGYNVADFNLGLATAQTFTLSFWVRSSLTGTFAVTFYNNALNRSYAATYTINAANTWEQKSITVTGDTTGTWPKDNTIGLQMLWSLGAGSSVIGSAGSWQGTFLRGVTGQTNFVATNGATWDLTGAQLEIGTVATPFERRDYGRELIMCQRYYEKSYNAATVPGTNITGGIAGQSMFAATNNDATGGAISGFVPFQTEKRAAPTTARFWDLAGNLSRVSNDTANNNKSLGAGAVFANSGERGYQYDFGVASATNARAYWCWDVSSEL